MNDVSENVSEYVIAEIEVVLMIIIRTIKNKKKRFFVILTHLYLYQFNLVI
jgi:hypothetical protein